MFFGKGGLHALQLVLQKVYNTVLQLGALPLPPHKVFAVLTSILLEFDWSVERGFH